MRPDPRFSRVKGSKLTVIYAWARKEFRNLLKAREMGVTVPIPYAVHKNVLVMEYIDGKKLLHDRPKEPKKFYEKLIKEVKKLKTAKLVHGDISEYNVLNFKENPVLIDFSHAVDLRYPNIERLVKRDVNNMVRYFRKLGLKLEEEEEFEKTWQDKK